MILRPTQQQMVKLAAPIFIETLLIMMLGAVDTFMLSSFSDDSVGAVGLVNQLVNLIFLVFEVIALGTTILCSQYIGAGLRSRMVQVVGVSLILNIVLGFVVSFILYCYSHELLVLMGLRPSLMSYGESYMRIVGAFAFFQGVSMAVSASLRSADKAFYPMMVTLVVNVLNIIGNYSLIFGKFGFPAMGVEGAAISTAFSRGVSMLILLIILFRKHIPSFPLKLFIPFPWKELRRLLSIGIPSAGEQVSYSLSQVVTIYFINMISDAALTARTYCFNVIMFTYLFAIAAAQGGAIVIGHMVGRGKPKAAFLIGNWALRMSIIISLSLSLILALLGPFIMRELTDNADIVKMGVAVLWIDVVLEYGRAKNIFAVNALRSSGDIYYPVCVGLIFQWIVAVGGAYLFGIILNWGLVGMWFAFLLDENIRGLVLVSRWKSKKWAHKGFV